MKLLYLLGVLPLVSAQTNDLCPKGTYSETGASPCTDCPAYQGTLSEGSTSAADCKCLPGFTPAGDDCSVCPAGAYCPDHDSVPLTCPENSYCPENSSKFFICDTNRNTNGATGASHASECICNSGFVDVLGTCEPQSDHSASDETNDSQSSENIQEVSSSNEEPPSESSFAAGEKPHNGQSSISNDESENEEDETDSEQNSISKEEPENEEDEPDSEQSSISKEEPENEEDEPDSEQNSISNDEPENEEDETDSEQSSISKEEPENEEDESDSEQNSISKEEPENEEDEPDSEQNSISKEEPENEEDEPDSEQSSISNEEPSSESSSSTDEEPDNERSASTEEETQDGPSLSTDEESQDKEDISDMEQDLSSNTDANSDVDGRTFELAEAQQDTQGNQKTIFVITGAISVGVVATILVAVVVVRRRNSWRSSLLKASTSNMNILGNGQDIQESGSNGPSKLFSAVTHRHGVDPSRDFP